MPLELDQIYSSLDELNVALGPNGANKNGALSDLLDTTAQNFGGQGAQFHQTIEDFSTLSQTLDDNKEALFGSARELEGFISTLATNDKTVRQFNQSLSDVSDLLSGEKEELAAALHNLSVGLGDVATFVQENRDILGKNITHINRVAKVLVKQRAALDETLHERPGGAQQPGADLQPAVRHPRHQRQPRRAGQPDRLRPGHAGLRLPQPGRQERPAVRPGRPGAQALGAVRHRVVVRPARSTSRSAVSWR